MTAGKACDTVPLIYMCALSEAKTVKVGDLTLKVHSVHGRKTQLGRIAREASLDAVAETWSMGLPITVARGDKIVKVYPDKREEIVGTIDGE